MEKKYILSEEDIRNLPIEQQREYNQFLDTIRNSGIVYRAELQKFNEILQQQYKTGVLFNPNSFERYPEILSKNINNVIDMITQVRNETIKGKRNFEQFNFEKIDEGLDELKNFVEKTAQGSNYKNAMGIKELEALSPRIEQLKGQISQDIIFYPKYRAEREKYIADYEEKQANYNKLTPFGRLMARINGNKKELEEAQANANYYRHGITDVGNREQGAIENPSQYDAYLKAQESVQEEVRMRR